MLQGVWGHEGENDAKNTRFQIILTEFQFTNHTSRTFSLLLHTSRAANGLLLTLVRLDGVVIKCDCDLGRL